jgi:ferredoxin--NADP+ reductase
MEGVEIAIDARQLVLPESLDPAERRRVQRNLTVLEQAVTAVRPKGDSGRRLGFGFLRSPIAIRGNTRVEEIEVGINRLELHEGRLRAVDTGEREVLPAGLVIRAVGYRGAVLPGVAFDEHTGVIPNVGGAVIAGEREYVAGWIKRGPSGIIGTNRADSAETAERLLVDLASRSPCAASAEAIVDWLGRKCPDMIDHTSWTRIDRCETAMGHAENRPRVKLVSVEAMLEAARETGR